MNRLTSVQSEMQFYPFFQVSEELENSNFCKKRQDLFDFLPAPRSNMNIDLI